MSEGGPQQGSQGPRGSVRQWVGFSDGILGEVLIGVNRPSLVLGRVYDVCLGLLVLTATLASVS